MFGDGEPIRSGFYDVIGTLVLSKSSTDVLGETGSASCDQSCAVDRERDMHNRVDSKRGNRSHCLVPNLMIWQCLVRVIAMIGHGL